MSTHRYVGYTTKKTLVKTRQVREAVLEVLREGEKKDRIIEGSYEMAQQIAEKLVLEGYIY